MIISTTHKFIFIHIMKAAGTSATMDLSKHLDWRDLVLGGTPLGEEINQSYMRHLRIGKHSRAVDVIKFVGEETWRDYFTFSFVRHPFHRTVSLYKYLDRYITKRRQGGLKQRALVRMGKFESGDWLSQLPEAKAFVKSDSFSRFIRLAHDMGGLGLQPQLDWLIDAQGEVAVDFVGKVENLTVDFASVLGKLGFPPVAPSAENQTLSQSDWRAYAKDDDLDFLAKIFERDFEAFSYDPGLR